ncbi:uncharacterized protein ACMZJ9_011683 [Mantella aurantiaca]
MEESSKCDNSMDTLQSYLEKDPNLLTDLQLSSSSDSSDISGSEEEEDSVTDGVQREKEFAEISQQLLDELERLEAEFQCKSDLLEAEDAEDTQVSKEDNTLEKLSQQPVLSLNCVLEDKPINHSPEYKPMNHLPEYKSMNHPPEYKSMNHPPEYEPMNHPPEYKPMNHPPDYKTMNHPPKYKLMNHPPEYKTMNHPPEYKSMTHPPEYKPTDNLQEDLHIKLLREDQSVNHLLIDRPLSDILESRPPSNVWEDSETLEGRSLNDLLEVRPLQPEQGQVTSESITTSKEEDLQPRDLEETVRRLMEEKKQNLEEIKQLKCHIQRLTEQDKDEQLERKSLALKLQKNQRKFLKLNRVSLAVTQEYAEMMGQLELEQDLRLEAEIMAHQMLREKKAVSRQSMILMQNLEPSEMLIKALDDVRTLTTTLEATKAELQTQVRSLELQLAERPSQEEYVAINEELNTIKIEKHQLEEKLKVEQEKCGNLQGKVKTLEEKLKEKESLANAQENVEMIAETTPLSPPPPPPPPLPVCPLSKAPKDPLALVRERRGLRPSAAEVMTVAPDVKEKAILEMKQRIERGDILRPTPKGGQRESAVNKRKSVISELQGVLLNTARKPLRRVSRRRNSRKAKDSQLSCLLQKRRQIVDRNPPTDTNTEAPKQTQECAAETKSQTQDEGGSQTSEVVCSFQNNPFVIQMRQRTSPVQSRRCSQVQWQ